MKTEEKPISTENAYTYHVVINDYIEHLFSQKKTKWETREYLHCFSISVRGKGGPVSIIPQNRCVFYYVSISDYTHDDQISTRFKKKIDDEHIKTCK